jgi:L-ribulose-5-phosphate 4-epimerase
MSVTEFRKPSTGKPASADKVALETVAATRMLVAEEILDYSGHISTRIPGRDAFVMQVGSDSRAELVPERMLVVDYDGKVLEGDGQPPSELPIHLEILRARPDVNCILHCHMELAITFTMMQGVQLVPMRSRAHRWRSGIPMAHDPSHIKTTEQALDLVKSLGPHNAVLMRAHGLTLVAESAQAVLIDAIHFKENAKAMMAVLQAGAKPIPLSEAEIAMIDKHEMREWHIHKLWNYYMRKGISEELLPSEWSDKLIPTKEMLTRK